MGFYTIKTPWLLKKMYPGGTWDIKTKEKVIYLTFDDGPHPIATPFVLETLRQFNAKATFFCIGKNVVQYPDIYRSIVTDGHRIGNHTFNHLDGWRVTDKEYFDNISLAAKHIDSNLFRPPYGKISAFQIKHLKASPLNYQIIMWDVLSADFDRKLTPEQCSFNVIRHSGSGSIVVFHDSEKAFERMKFALPECLKYFTDKGYRFDVIPALD
ncbi:MAG: polysaccharide deacetylase family protein [Chitinophagaceae bacterium]|nr:MAG: polysaccharide deacetylase family protein [Chitinophagaceae bacterium]